MAKELTIEVDDQCGECGHYHTGECTDSHRVIGYLVEYQNKNRVACVRCFDAHFATQKIVRVYKINVYPYKQSCVWCETLLVEGSTTEWPELFDGR